MIFHMAQIFLGQKSENEGAWHIKKTIKLCTDMQTSTHGLSSVFQKIKNFPSFHFGNKEWKNLNIPDVPQIQCNYFPHKKDVKLPLSVPGQHVDGAEIQLHSFLTLALGKVSAQLHA